MYLETQRLTLRRMEDRDFEDWCAFAMDPDRCLMMGTEALTTREKARETFDWLMVHEKRFYAVALTDEGRCVGYIIVKNFPPVGDLPELHGKTGRSLTFCVSREYRRRGIALEALEATVRYLFEVRGVDYVNSGYFTFNEPSRRLHEKLGFQPMTESAVELPDGRTTTAIETVLFNPNK